MRDKNLTTKEWNLRIIVKEFNFLNSFFEIFEFVLFSFDLFLEILELGIKICKFIYFLLIFEGNIYSRILSKLKNL